jgi:hypothetical protein
MLHLSGRSPSRPGTTAASRTGRRAAKPAYIQDATIRYLLYGLVPAWVVPAAADWALHRRTKIEETAGARESAIHLAMMSEVGLPAVAALTCEVDPALLAAMLAGAAAHEATALWDVHAAQDAGRTVSVVEQHVHSFLEALPLTGLSIIACLHPDQVRALAAVVAGRAPLPRRLTLRRPGLPRRYLGGVFAGIGVLAVLYLEEFWRCVKAARERRLNAAPYVAMSNNGSPAS